MRFGQIIKTRRQSLGISQEQLSELAGLSQFRIGEIERESKDNILLEELTSIGKALQINKIKAWIELDKELG